MYKSLALVTQTTQRYRNTFFFLFYSDVHTYIGSKPMHYTCRLVYMYIYSSFVYKYNTNEIYQQCNSRHFVNRVNVVVHTAYCIHTHVTRTRCSNTKTVEIATENVRSGVFKCPGLE